MKPVDRIEPQAMETRCQHESSKALAGTDVKLKSDRGIRANSPKRVWLLTNAPSPYQAELFTAVAQSPDIELHVQLMRGVSTSGKAVEASFSRRTLTGLAPTWIRDEFRVHPQAIWDAARGNYDCYILSGLYTSITFQCCAAILRLTGKPWCVWLERPHSKPGSKTTGINRIKDHVLKSTLRSADQVWCIGSLARQEYLQRSGGFITAPVLPYCCDTKRYTNVNTQAIKQIRDKHQLHDCMVFLFSGQMIQRKGVDILLAAFEIVAQRHPNAKLLLLGDGVLRTSLMSQVPPHLRYSVVFTGHVDQKDLPTYFLAANVFVFPSRHDGWGVVINEACASGLPIITTPNTGAAFDLVEEGRNGYLVEPDNVEMFAQRMSFFCEHPNLARKFGQHSQTLVEQFSIENGARLFRDNVLAMTSPSN